ncbi:MAG: hypothetical protein QME62_11570 [Armatimonadota bacterium]|nr:hypothetical protein [Armatimonadota bacterium]
MFFGKIDIEPNFTNNFVPLAGKKSENMDGLAGMKTAELVLITILIIALYIVSSRWRSDEPVFLGARMSFWLGLAAALVAVVLIAISKSRHF